MNLSIIPFTLSLIGLLASSAVYSQTPYTKSPGLASISAEQVEKLKNALVASLPDPAVMQAIKEGVSALFPFLRIESCMISSAGASQLNAYAAPNKSFEYSYGNGPIPNMQYHDKGVCVSVLRIQGWQMPAKNALRFETVYSSEISGETVKKKHEIVKQVSGEWLFTE